MIFELLTANIGRKSGSGRACQPHMNCRQVAGMIGFEAFACHALKPEKQFGDSFCRPEATHLIRRRELQTVAISRDLLAGFFGRGKPKPHPDIFDCTSRRLRLSVRAA